MQGGLFYLIIFILIITIYIFKIIKMKLKKLHFVCDINIFYDLPVCVIDV